MGFEMSYVLVGLMQVVGFFVQGCTGFGCTVIAAAVTNGMLGTATGVPYGTLITLPFLYYLAIKSWRDVSWKDLLKIIVLCAPGLLLGNVLFYSVSETTAKIGIGAMVTLIAVMNIYKYIIKPMIMKKKQATETGSTSDQSGSNVKAVETEEEVDTIGKKVFRYGCLMLGGVVHGAFNIGGPLITVYTIESVKEKEKFRNTMNMVWVVLNTFNAFNQFRNGAFTPALFSALAIGVPMAAVGFAFGMAFLKKINRETFLRIVYVVLFIIGIDMLIKNIALVM